MPWREHQVLFPQDFRSELARGRVIGRAAVCADDVRGQRLDRAAHHGPGASAADLEAAWETLVPDLPEANIHRRGTADVACANGRYPNGVGRFRGWCSFT